eukprot:jgi/Tetstr1/428707/TSEL_018695.t1
MTETARPTAHARLARAKLNYALHVTGQRADGYHLIDSLAVFPAIGDRVGLGPRGSAPGLTLSGRFAADLVPSGDPSGDASADNLVTAAARRLAAHLDRDADVALELKKTLPVASGIGGGSADAAAVLRLLRDLWAPDLDDETLADGFGDLDALCAWLKATRNDLERPARGIAPEVDGMLAALGGCAGAMLARMSGSGATCFAIFATLTEAQAAEQALHAAHPGWWVAAAPVERIGAFAG